MTVDSPQSLAYGLNDGLKLGLTPRPWQMYQPTDTFWWLVPSSDWPAYRYGKLAFCSAKDVPRQVLLGPDDSLLHLDKIFAGLNVEKGFGHVASVVDPQLQRRTSQILAPNWTWYAVVDDHGPERFTRLLTKLSAETQVHLYVVASPVHDREGGHRPEHDAVLFEGESGGIRALLDNGFPVDALRGTELSRSFGDLAAGLRDVGDYHWVDLYAGTYVDKGDVNPADFGDRVLSHFLEWLV